MFWFFKKKIKINKSEEMNTLYSKIKSFYFKDNIDYKRREELSKLIEKYGYLPYSQAKAINELTLSEVIFCLEKKLELNGTLKNNELIIQNNNPSVLSRNKINNSNWIKREQQDIKLINLSGLGDGFKDMAPGKFIDWLRQIVILPSGNKDILSTIIYLVPFTPRDFGNAYLQAGTEEVSTKIEDKELLKFDESLNAKTQIKLFITLAQLAGHPVIYDVVPQQGRYSKTILSRPYLARWVDVEFLIEEIAKSLDFVALKLNQEFDEDDITIVKNIYKTTLKSGSCDLSIEFKPIYERFTMELEQKRKDLANFMSKKSEQKKLQKRVQAIVAKIEGVKPNKIKHDKDITKRGEIINALINEGLWTLPDGAWCSSGIPIFEKMSETGAYPIFRHYNARGEDVSSYAESDCETPFYFVYLENGKYNKQVVDFYIDYLKGLQKEYNFDGYRISHTDFVVDEMSEKELRPISYRAPRLLLERINETMKSQVPYFVSMAEYRLWNSYYKEYHQDMKFDVLWGNDTKTDYEKTPNEVIANNRELQDYNKKNYNGGLLSIIKTYNNQDGEFRTANRSISLADKEEALFRWFKFRFLPGGRYAQRPILYCEGDESFSKDGIESTIRQECSLMRSNDEDFYNRFNAIRRFSVNNELTLDGEAQVITKNKDGFISWMISKETSKERLVIAANYLSEKERLLTKNENGISQYKVKINKPVEDKKIELPVDYVLVSEFIYEPDKKDFVEHYFNSNIKSIKIKELKPSEFRIYKIKR